MFSSVLLLFGLASISQYVMSTNEMLLAAILNNDRKINESIFPEKVVVKLEEKIYHVLLYNTTSRLYFCGGTLLNRFYVLTAAECVVNRQREEIRVHAHRINLWLTRNWFVGEVRKIIIHDEYDPLHKWHNDIALVRQTPVFPYDSQYASVPNSYDFEQMIKEARPLPARISGYGIISEYKKPTSHQMLKADTYIYTWELCKEVFKMISYNISTSVICAHDPEYYENLNTTRISDVGSPLIYDSDKVVGIALSANWDFQYIEDGYLYYPLLFTNTSVYSEWIRSHMTDI